jgi:hypothetical protein
MDQDCRCSINSPEQTDKMPQQAEAAVLNTGLNSRQTITKAGWDHVGISD